MISFSAAVVGFVIFLGMLFLAIPVALSIFFTCLLAAVMYVGLPSLTTFGSTAWSTLNNFILTAIPLFILLGELLIKKGIKPVCAAGHSLGEYSALALGKSFNFETGLELVKIRAEAMQESCRHNEGSMAAVIGLKDEEVIKVCDSNSNEGIVVAANFNAKAQVVISGESKAIKSIIPLMKEAGALKVIELNVSGAFHSPLMSSAKKVLSDKLLSTNINDSNFPIYSNVTAYPISSADEIQNALIEQLEKPVLWHQSISQMINDGVENAIEVGPGKVLQGLSKRINSSLNMNSLEYLEDIVNFKHV